MFLISGDFLGSVSVLISDRSKNGLLSLESLPGEPTSAHLFSSGALFGTQGAESEKKGVQKWTPFLTKCRQKLSCAHHCLVSCFGSRFLTSQGALLGPRWATEASFWDLPQGTQCREPAKICQEPAKKLPKHRRSRRHAKRKPTLRRTMKRQAKIFGAAVACRKASSIIKLISDNCCGV